MLSKVLPWSLVVLFLAAAGFFFSASHRKDTELTELREKTAQVETMQTELEQLRTTSTAQAEEIGRLQTNTAELLRLRNQVYQLGQEKQQLTRQLQTAQANAAIGQQHAQQVQQLQAQNQALVTAKTQADQVAMQNQCINNLRQIDGAKQQWALENKKRDQDVPTANEMAAYMKGSQMPVCPSGGTYTIGAVNQEPVCSIPGHALPPP